MTAKLSVDSLSKTFRVHALGGDPVVGLDDVSFVVDEGEFLAVVGESGSGKSSLLKCLYRTYRPTSGRARYRAPSGEVDLAACDGRTVLALRGGTLAYTSQFLDEIPRVPAVDVVARPLVEAGTDRETARDRARDLLGRLGLPETRWRAYPATFSGGERRRVNVAQAVATDPDLLLLDEPTSALDPDTRETVVTLLREVRDRGTTVVCALHDRRVVAAVADRVLELDDGRVVRDVPVEAFDADGGADG
jgi:alpha-D-ribose 1-methylphosphonate 5-triphosphate synthase subunit PhnL